MRTEKYQVFISSPFRKLKAERKAAVESVVNWGQIPIALENFTARAAKDYQVIEKAIDDCQIYILVLGHTCGSLMPDGNQTYTEYEFNKAVSKGMDVLAFLQDLDEAKQEIDGDRDIEDKGIEKKRLEQFHQLVSDKERIFYRPWSKSTNFEEICSRALGELIYGENGVTLPGWIRARVGDELTVQMNIFARDMVRNINGFVKLNERCSMDVPEKQTLAICFRDRFLDKIIDDKIDLFFESGDCPAFVARELGQIKRFAKVVVGSRPGDGINLYTNNILAFLELLMNDRIPVTMRPKSSPQDVYGASYGILDELIDDERVPDYSGAELNQFAFDAIEELSRSGDALEVSDVSKILLICSISGIQISKNHIIDTKVPLDTELQKRIERCYGFHVGSFKNLVFKRYLYSTKAPILMTATRSMLDMMIDPSRCHFLFNDTFTWQSFYATHPLAFLVGCKDSQIRETQELLGQMDFAQEIFQHRGFAAVIAANEAFLETTNIGIGKTHPKSSNKEGNDKSRMK
jgi:hypothetical protein